MSRRRTCGQPWMVMGRVVWGWGRGRDTLTGTAGVSVWTSGAEASVASGCKPGPAQTPHCFSSVASGWVVATKWPEHKITFHCSALGHGSTNLCATSYRLLCGASQVRSGVTFTLPTACRRLDGRLVFFPSVPLSIGEYDRPPRWVFCLRVLRWRQRPSHCFCLSLQCCGFLLLAGWSIHLYLEHAYRLMARHHNHLQSTCGKILRWLKHQGRLSFKCLECWRCVDGWILTVFWLKIGFLFLFCTFFGGGGWFTLILLFKATIQRNNGCYIESDSWCGSRVATVTRS